MREGEALSQTGAFAGQPYFPTSGFTLAGMAGLGAVDTGAMGEQKILWREKTGSKTGWLVKSDEQKTLRISGRRCAKCGYVELYAHEET